MATEPQTVAPTWFSIREAAAYLKVGEPTIYRWMRDGRITFRKVGDSTRFLKEDLDGVVEVFPSQRDTARAAEFCPACHHTVLAEGDLRSTGVVQFQPARTRFWTLRGSSIPVRALMCAQCGTIVPKGDPARLAALQPGEPQAAGAEHPPASEE
jgi:excisionase family DNA binding protein